MSVILYENAKFVRIYKTLAAMDIRLNIAWLVGYPEGWKTEGIDYHLRGFVNDLRRANIACWNENYPDDVVMAEVVDYDEHVAMYVNSIEMYKSLRALRYNLCTNAGREKDVNGASKRLDNLIDHVGAEIIMAMPEWEKADTW